MLGSLISGGLNLLGGILGSSSQEKANAANLQFSQMMARRGIQLKVEDAKKAGIHPLYALGAPVNVPAPSQVGDTSMPTALANMGQDISRAVHAGSSHAERQLSLRMAQLGVERAELENAALASRVANVGQAGTPPAIPMPTDRPMIAGQGDVQFAADPRVAMVKPPSANVETVKWFGYPLIRNPRLFSSGDAVQQEFGDAEVVSTGHALPAYAEAFSRAVMMRNIADYIKGKALADKMRRDFGM